jgi:long-subunit acyl-CoA synthetase (AMP-forming)
VAGAIAKNELNLSRRGYCGRLLDGLNYKLKAMRSVPGLPHEVGELCLKGPAVAKGYLNPEDTFSVDEDGYFATGDLAYVDDDGWVFLVGRRKEQIAWEDGRFTDPMQVSNLLVRSIWIKDGLVLRRDGEDVLSVFVFPDYKRIEKSEVYKKGIDSGLERRQVLRSLLLDAIDYAQSLLGSFPRISTEKIYLLNRKLERTPTHKIKMISELEKLDFSMYV